MKKLFPLLIISFLAWLPTTDAQLTISGEDAVVCDNGTVSIDVTVSNFIDITSAQFSITWDPDVVQFTSVSNNMPASALYNTVNAPTGELRFSWFDANPPPGYTPVGPPAGSQIIFTINFNIVGDYSTDNFTSIVFGSVPGFSMEVASASGIIPNGSIVLDPGSVTLDDIVPPSISCPANVTVTAGVGQPSANVSYPAPLVMDNCDVPSVPAVCSPASGSAFLIGTTTVNCTATDGAGNSANCSFSVTVNPPPANPNALVIAADDFAITCNDTVVNVPVRVENFTQMTSAQFALVWDELVLDYTGYTDSINATGHATALYNFANTPTGEFRFSWFDADGVPGEDLADSAVIFTLHFKVLDENELPDTVVITGVPGFGIEFSDTGGILGPGDFVFADAIISVVPDTIAPSITCPVNQTLAANANCEATLLDYTTMAVVTDNCSDPMDIIITQTPAAGTVITDTTEVRLIATDEVGLMDTCYFDVNFVDNTLPVIICAANETLDVDSAACFATFTLSAATATDNCGIATTTNDGPAGGEFPVGTTTVTFTTTDVNGNVATCQVDILVNDTLPPVITCPADIMQANDAGDCSAVVTWATPTVVDNCTNLTITCIPPSGTVFPVGDSTVVCIVEDTDGNMDTCTFLVTVFDNEAPSMTCVSDTSILVPAGTLDTIVEDIYLFSLSDNCSLDTLYYTLTGALTGDGDGVDVSGTAFPVGTTTVTYFGVDEVGNVGSCSFDVSIVEDMVITIACSPDQVVSIDSSDCSATVTGVTATVQPLAFVQDTFFTITGATVNSDTGLDASGIFNVGVSTVTFYAISTVGDTVSCTTTITVNDTIVPVITCPADIMQANDLGDCSAIVTWATPTVVDNCTNVTITCIPPSGTVFPVGDSTVVCIVEDPSGNMDTCSFIVTVFDNEPLNMQCVPDTTILVPIGTVDTIVEDIYLFSLSDNCSLDTLYYTLTGTLTGDGDGVDVSGMSFPVGTTTITYFGEDEVGNVGSCSFDVTIQEDVNLAITCSPAQTLDNDPGICTTAVTGVTADAQPSASVTSSFYETTGATVGNGTGLDASGTYNGGLTTVTFYAVSTIGDTVSCSTTVMVNDTELPVFTNCPTDTITMNTSLTQCGVVFSGSIVPLATDNCPNLDLSYNFDLDSLIPIGINTLVASAMDMAGNATTCTFVLEVIDNEAPTFTNCTNGNSISRVNDPNQCGAIVAFGPIVGAMDNCSLLAFTETSPGNGDFFPTGTTIITYTAVDNVGNVSTCEITVTVTDTQPPSLTCPGNLNPVFTDLNMCSASVNFVVPTADDNCGVISFGPTTPVGPVFPEGVNTVSYEATDAAGNTTTCTFTVTVVDNQFPFIPNMPADITVYTNSVDCGANVFWTPPSPAIDNCGIDTYGPSGGDPGDFFAVGTNVVKYVAMDINGNITVENLNITVLDTLPPAINCPAGISVTVDGGTLDDPDGFLTTTQQIDCDNIQLDYAALMASDACGVGFITQTAGLPSGSPFPIGNTVMSFEATDNYGNTSVCSFSINVLDYQIAPAMVSQGLVCEGGSVTFSVDTLPGASYTWITGNDTVSTNATFTIADAALNQSGIYTVVVSTAYCDIQFTTELNVSAVPIVTIDADDVQCTTSGLPLVLMGLDSSTANVTNWTWTFPNGNTSAGQTQIIPNPTPANSGTYCVTATTLFGCTASACVSITVSNGPPTPALFGSTSALCLGTAVTITNATLYSGNSITYNWYATPQAGSGLLQSINNPIINPTPTLPGSYTYHLFMTVDGCISDTAEWAVVVEAAPIISLSVVGETQCVDGGSNITLMDNGTGAVSWVWSGPIPLPPVNTNSVVLQNVVPAYSGTYTVVATSAIGCTSSASTQLTITAAPAPPQLTTTSFSICDGETVTLAGTQYNAPVTYIWIGAGVPPNSQNNNQIDVTPPNGPGDYVYSFAASVNGCTSDTDSVTVTVTPSPVLVIDVVGETNCVDGTSSITLSTAATGLTNIVWTDGLGNVLAQTNPFVLTNVTSEDSDEIFLTATSQGCTGFGSTTLSISNGIDGLAANSSMADCPTATVTLEATAIANATYAWFRPPNGQLFATTQNTTLANATDGTYTVVAAVNGCTDTATVEVNLPNTLNANDKIVLGIVDVPQDFNILATDVYEPGQPFTITILQEATNGTVTYHEQDSIYTYTPNAGFWGSDFIIYQICYTECPDFCSTAKVTFDINYDPGTCVVTTVISPNDDGINDEFVVSCVENNGYPLNTLYIFNQWGDKVYEAAPYKNDWRGTYDGKDLPDATYFYIFQRDPDTPVQKGFVMIYR